MIQPSDSTGNVRKPTMTVNWSSSPRVSSPRITCAPPTARITSSTSPSMKMKNGQMKPRSVATRIWCRTYSRLSVSNRAYSASSIVYSLTVWMPAMTCQTRLLMAASVSWIRRYMGRRRGSTTTIIRMSTPSIPVTTSMREPDRANSTGMKNRKRVRAFGTYMTPGPSRVRTSLRSLVQRLIRSPVWLAW